MQIKSAEIGALDPATLDMRSQEAVRALLREGSSQNTVKAYGAAIRYWSAWFNLRYGQILALPLAPAVVVQFVVDHVLHTGPQGLTCQLPPAVDRQLVEMKVKARPGPLSLGTVMHRLSVLSKAHQIQGHGNPCQQAQVRELLSRTRRAYAKRGVAPVQKAALTRDLLEKVLATCDDTLKGRRDRALLLFAWATGGRRRSEVVQATMENTKQVSEQAYLYVLHQSKTNQAGARHAHDTKPLLGSAALALTRWLEASDIRTGPIFRRVRRGNVVAEPLSAAAVRKIVQDRCAQAGVSGDFSAHSLRSGFVTEAGRQNTPLGDTMALTGHASVATVMGYFRAGSVLHSDASNLFDSAKHQPQDSAPSTALHSPEPSAKST